MTILFAGETSRVGQGSLYNYVRSRVQWLKDGENLPNSFVHLKRETI